MRAFFITWSLENSIHKSGMFQLCHKLIARDSFARCKGQHRHWMSRSYFILFEYRPACFSTIPRGVPKGRTYPLIPYVIPLLQTFTSQDMFEHFERESYLRIYIPVDYRRTKDKFATQYFPSIPIIPNNNFTQPNITYTHYK